MTEDSSNKPKIKVPEISRLLVTGSRNFDDRKKMSRAFKRVLEKFGYTDDLTLISGGARGADSLAESIFRNWGFNVEVHKAEWDRYGKRAGHIRNSEMVKSGADICVAFPIGESRGTRNCMDQVRKAGIPLVKVKEDSGNS